MLKVSELINQTDQELASTLVDIERELFELRNRLRVERKLDKPHLIKEKKRDRARIFTALKQKGQKESK